MKIKTTAWLVLAGLMMGVAAFAGIISDTVKKGSTPEDSTEYLTAVPTKTNCWSFYVSVPTNTYPDNTFPSGEFPMGATIRRIRARTDVGSVKFKLVTNLWSSALTSYGSIRDGFEASVTASNAAQVTTLSKTSRMIGIVTNVAAGTTGLTVNVEYTVP